MKTDFANSNNNTAGKPLSQRQQRFGENVRKALAEAFLRGDVYEQVFSDVAVTITEVRMSPDLRQADVFFMTLGGVRIDEVKDALVKETPNLRSIVAKKVYAKFVPHIIFREDKSFAEAEKIENLFKAVNDSQ